MSEQSEPPCALMVVLGTCLEIKTSQLFSQRTSRPEGLAQPSVTWLKARFDGAPKYSAEEKCGPDGTPNLFTFLKPFQVVYALGVCYSLQHEKGLDPHPTS